MPGNSYISSRAELRPIISLQDVVAYAQAAATPGDPSPFVQRQQREPYQRNTNNGATASHLNVEPPTATRDASAARDASGPSTEGILPTPSPSPHPQPEFNVVRRNPRHSARGGQRLNGTQPLQSTHPSLLLLGVLLMLILPAVSPSIRPGRLHIPLWEFNRLVIHIGPFWQLQPAAPSKKLVFMSMDLFNEGKLPAHTAATSQVRLRPWILQLPDAHESRLPLTVPLKSRMPWEIGHALPGISWNRTFEFRLYQPNRRLQAPRLPCRRCQRLS